VISSSVLLHCNGEVFSLESIRLDFAIAGCIYISSSHWNMNMCFSLFQSQLWKGEKGWCLFTLVLLFYVNGFVNIRDRFEIRISLCACE
jgi:hypothetical protein